MPKLHIYKNEKETCYAFAGWLADLAKETLEKQERFTIALSGVDTPKLIYKILATEYETKIDWSRIHLFLGDERLVSFPDDRNSASATLKTLTDFVPLPPSQIHFIKTDIPPGQAAQQYEALLRNYFGEKTTSFDLVILGIGELGNLLSLSSYQEEANQQNAWVIPVLDKQEDVFKVTLTIAAINASSVKAFLVTGKKKEDVVQQVLKGKYEPEKYPAQLIVTANRSVHWFLDEEAAGKLIRPIS
ncbi:MAG: 6-phosphogluconolactonase [Bacteroidota bacterium]|nr:6-phosphogluconolactonase [Bacteroidota bacterium]